MPPMDLLLRAFHYQDFWVFCIQNDGCFKLQLNYTRTNLRNVNLKLNWPSSYFETVLGKIIFLQTNKSFYSCGVHFDVKKF
jgi:hypothetical protein